MLTLSVLLFDGANLVISCFEIVHLKRLLMINLELLIVLKLK